MKAGDLVTLSAYANKLGPLHQWSEYYRQVIKKPALVGLVIKASPRAGATSGRMKCGGWKPMDPKAGMVDGAAPISTAKI